MSSQTKNLAKMFVTLLLFASPALRASEGLKQGDVMPALAGFGLEGRVPATQGKIVWLDFCASWCGPCRASFPVMDKIHAKYKDKGLVVLGVSVDDDSKKWQAFVEKQNVSFPLVRDAQHKLVSLAGIEKMPTSFLIDGNGKIVSVHHGFKGKETEEAVEREIQSLLK